MEKLKLKNDSFLGNSFFFRAFAFPNLGPLGFGFRTAVPLFEAVLGEPQRNHVSTPPRNCFDTKHAPNPM
eukprot:3981762-Amphidinium_carterae.1